MFSRSPLIVAGITLALMLCIWAEYEAYAIPHAFAQDGVSGGLEELEEQVNVPTETSDFRTSIGSAIRFVVTFVALAAIVTIIVSGFILILGFGTEGSVQRTKKIFLYTVLGLVIIFFVRVIVGFFTEELAGSFT